MKSGLLAVVLNAIGEDGIAILDQRCLHSMVVDGSFLSFILSWHRIGSGTDQEQRLYRDRAIARLKSNDRTASIGIAVGIRARSSSSLVRIEEGNVKIAVLITTPTPVDVIKTIAVGTITNKLVANGRTVAAIHDRTLSLQLGIQ